MVRFGMLRNFLPLEIAVIAAEVHHQHIAGKLPLQHPIQQTAAFADRGPEMGVVMDGKLEFRFQRIHIHLVLGFIAPTAQVHLNSL